MVLDFYTPAAVTSAKELFVDNVAALNIEQWTRPVNRRNNSDNKFRNEVDDIFALLVFVDEKGLFDKIPKCVSANPEQLPLMRMEKGDVTVILNKIDRLETTLDSMKSELSENRSAIAKLFNAKNSLLNSPLRRVGLQGYQSGADVSVSHAWPGSNSNTLTQTHSSHVKSWADATEQGYSPDGQATTGGEEDLVNEGGY